MGKIWRTRQWNSRKIKEIFKIIWWKSIHIFCAHSDGRIHVFNSDTDIGDKHLYIISLKRVEANDMETRGYAFCMVFHVRWIFLTTSLPIPPESRSDEGGIRRRVVRNPSHMENHTKCIFSHTLHLRHFNQAKYTV